MQHTSPMVPEPAPEAVTGGRAEHERRPIAYAAVGIVVILLAGGVVLWNRVAAHRAGQVEVMWSGNPECIGAKVVDFTEDSTLEDHPWSGPLIRAKRGMRCSITVEVHNRSGGTVLLDHATLPFMAPRDGGPVIRVDAGADPELWSTRGPGDDIDLIRTLDTTLRPAEQATFDVPIVFRNGGCSGGRGGRMLVYGFPTVAVKALLFSFERPALNDLAFSQYGRAAGCSSLGG